eukprot:GHVH01000295.1.p1 GENE.GHVH01000295.1~~GHVH01000295.1.p1  ORF type:complete len:680 (+),score=124.53 GHVH01000295.1:230-2269(+)
MSISNQLKQSVLGSSFVSITNKRFLNLHEYQSKDLLDKYHVTTSKGGVASTPQETLAVSQRLKKEGVDKLVIKAQVLAGGRGKGTLSSGLQGGVQIDKSPQAMANYAKAMLNYNLVTKQTPPEGLKVNKVFVVEAADIDKELYLAMLLDRAYQGVVIVASTEGGMEIEDVAENSPEKVHKIPVKDVKKGIQEDEVMAVIKALELDKNPKLIAAARKEITNMYKLFVETDCTQLEINPICLTKDPNRPIVSVDAKLNFDDFAGFRQAGLFAQEDKATRDPRELAAEEFDLNFVGMDGSVGCLVNGAGLAMSTMDLVNFCGGSPANFLDVGGGANEEQIKQAFTILQNDPNVTAIFVNIFGGIMRCNIVAEGMINAAKSIGLRVPLVVRLVGTNSELARDIIKKARSELGLDIHPEDDFQSAAQLVVDLSKKGEKLQSFHVNQRGVDAITEEFKSRPLRLIFMGAPGSGKGTQSEILLENYNVVHLCTGDMLREEITKGTPLGKVAKGIIHAGQLVDDATMIGIIESKLKALPSDKGFILDGFPRTQGQAEALDAVLEGLGLDLSGVIEFGVPNEDVIERICGRWIHKASGRSYHETFFPARRMTRDSSGRVVGGFDDETGDPLMKRPDDNRETVGARLEAYDSATMPVLEHYKKAGKLLTLDARDKMNTWRWLQVVLGDK